LLAGEKELNWTFLSPSALFIDGERTARFRLGTDQLLTAADGKSWISFEDFAVALADEIERPAISASVSRSAIEGAGRPAGPDRFACARLWGRPAFRARSYCLSHVMAI